MNSESEATLVEYLVHCNDMYFGLSAKETRGLAFEFAKKLNLKIPASWEAARMAGEDNWLSQMTSNIIHTQTGSDEFSTCQQFQSNKCRKVLCAAKISDG